MAWWEYNGRTELFASSHEARRVRCAIKAGVGLALGSAPGNDPALGEELRSGGRWSSAGR